MKSSFLVMSPFQSEGSDGQQEREMRVFPEEGREETITCMSLTQDFLIYGTEVHIERDG